MTTGRRPNADGLNLTEVGIKRDGRGAVFVEEGVRTYLTTVEGLKLAAQSFGEDVAKLSYCAG